MLALYYCSDRFWDSLYIPSSDGIDIDSCDGVRITGVDIDVNDDCIAIKSGKDEDGRRVNRPAENILIENCRFRYGHGAPDEGVTVNPDPTSLMCG